MFQKYFNVIIHIVTFYKKSLLLIMHLKEFILYTLRISIIFLIKTWYFKLKHK